MKYTIILLCGILFAGCKQESKDNPTVERKNSTQTETNVSEPTVSHDTISEEQYTVRKFSNARFREVQVTKTGDKQYLVEGQGQIFEASFGWVVEDGHDELQNGNSMTDAGAPDWGSFRFTVNVEKARPQSTLTLVLFESSAKDGSRQHELAIPLRD
jgi:immunoglobulin-like protein involved in spore germination